MIKEVKDSGPIYTETNMGRFPVEPFNTFSNLIFLFIIIYWYRRLATLQQGRFARFLKVSLPILSIGYVGGSIYHATRSHPVWLFMDFVPIAILALYVAWYFWGQVIKTFWPKFLILLALFIIPRLVIRNLGLNMATGISLGYLSLSIPILFPVMWVEYKRGWKTWRWFLAVLSILVLAVNFRLADSSPWVIENFPVGTHWLWHITGGVMVQIFLLYIEKLEGSRG
ncbi:MAG: hypothetical protein KDD33_02500 [Bdellovibrionales bacterium]|nr:hypothetical protein [Bdellovibrionales bacterium]